MRNKYRQSAGFFEDKKNKKLYQAYLKSTKSYSMLYYYKKDGKYIRTYSRGSKKYDPNVIFISKRTAMEKYPQYFI
jgi:hypothetical protein